MSRLLPLLVAVPLFGAALLVAVGRRLPRTLAEVLALAASAGTAGLALALLFATPGDFLVWVGGWTPRHGESVGIVLIGDRAGVGLVALVSLLVVAVLVYSWRYFEEPPRRHAGTFPALVLLFQAGMCGFAITGDLFNAFVFFELMSVVAYALTGYRVEDPKAVQGALTFGVVTSLGAYATLMGIVLLYARTGELGMRQIGARLDQQGGPDALVLSAFVLVLTGLLVKAAAAPFHFWLPDAHAVAPTPVCMLLSGVMVELGVYGVWRVHDTVFAGTGGIPAPSVTRALVTLGALSAAVGAVMCWQQRHLKRLLAFSTVAHTGLFLVGVGLLTPEGRDGVAIYLLGHSGVKAALFAATGILLDRYGSVDEHELHGRARGLRSVACLFAVGGLALAGLPPFGSGLGKAVTEEAAGGPLTVLFVVVSAATGGAALRVAARVFLGWGPRPASDRPYETSGTGEEPETGAPLGRVPLTMLTVPAVLLTAALLVGAVPGCAAAVGRALGTPPALLPHWSAAGVGLGLTSTALAVGLAALAVRTGSLREGLYWTRPLRRLHSGHVGDYVAWLLAGTVLLGALALPGVLSG
ncbi:complex I subunit 5 family protein [Streptomyces sp. TS71-3]|uniref:complex I subunit 5 family protein n=1 Tax=Streptomyces sp. TS71-3 TaxID=2733862 RepID=UPI001B19FCF3|nr:complex I subunit 5 family protein [Streptomyces sp. TS71-3]GHJ42507.1 cation:proton antiporter [Streptomyces sp. TS71-3]